MKEVLMSLSEIRSMFGEDIAKQCETMRNHETKEFHTATYEAIIVRCEHYFNTIVYYVTAEYVLEEAIEFDSGMDMDF